MAKGILHVAAVELETFGCAKMFKRPFSFVGRRPIILPSKDVCLSIEPILHHPKNIPETHKTTANLQRITIAGKLGEAQFDLVDGLLLNTLEAKEKNECAYEVSLNEQRFECLSKYQKKFVKSMWGLTSTQLSNMVTGVTEGFTAIVRLVGVGYRVSQKEVPPSSPGQPDSIITKQQLALKIGYSNEVMINVPACILKIAITENATKLRLTGIDKQQVYLFAHLLKKLRPPNVYTGKGIYVDDETIVRKQMKKK